MMDNALHYLALNRQRGLSAELSEIANNIANLSTPGFRREGAVFSEFVVGAGTGGSLSMADMNARFTDSRPGRVETTGGAFDLAIVGEGFFQVLTDAGPRLTRSGAFLRDSEGLLASQTGALVLDEAGAPIFMPADAGKISVGKDGTISAGGLPVGQIAVVSAPDIEMSRDGRTVFKARGRVEPAEDYTILHKALEGSNVDPVGELARMIEVTRAYEGVQSIIEDEDQRIRGALETLARA